jgi:hypothetical protein
MEFQVPQFIQREMKVAGPLTFKQSLFIGGGALGVFVLYLILAQRSFFLFAASSFIIVAIGLALAFIKVQGRSLPTVVANFFLFTLSGKTYLWKKRAYTPKVVGVKKPEPKMSEKKAVPRITEKSQLQNLSTKLETGMQ